MIPDRPVDDVVQDFQLEKLVEELDALLDAWFMGDVAPALEQALRARASAEAA